MVVSLSHSDERRLPTSVSFETVNQPSSLSDRRLSDIVPHNTNPKATPPSNSPTLFRNRRVSSASSSNSQLEQANNHRQQSYNVAVSSNPIMASSASPPSSLSNPNTSGTQQRSMFSHRTRSDDDCDYANVVLRNKSSHSIMGAPTTHHSVPVISTAKSKNTMDRSSSIPITPTKPSDTDDPMRSSPNTRDIDQIRAFLESEYVAPTDEFWHMQRDSFIHRSYNKKLLARKNAIDAYETPKRPASMPATTNNHNQPQPIPPLPCSDENQQSQQPKPQAVSVKRDSFIRSSFNSLRRSFSIRTSSAKRKSAQMERRSARLTRAMTADQEALPDHRNGDLNCNGNNNNREGYTVSDEGERWDRVDSGGMTFLNVPLENVRNLGHSRNSSTSSCTSNR